MRQRLLREIPLLSEAGGEDHGETAGSGQPLRLAVLGDSAAAGVGAPNHQVALAGQTADTLALLTGRALSWRVTARSGATARTIRRDLVPRLTDPHTQWRPDIVLLVVGVNDATRLRPPAAFRRDVALLIATIRSHLGTPVPVLLAGLPPVSRFPVLPTPLRQLLGIYARRLDHQLHLLARPGKDVFHLPVGSLPIYRPDFFAEDKFHPSPVGYRAWGRILGMHAATVLEYSEMI